jgi:hypothetical protein
MWKRRKNEENYKKIHFNNFLRIFIWKKEFISIALLSIESMNEKRVNIFSTVFQLFKIVQKYFKYFNYFFLSQFYLFFCLMLVINIFNKIRIIIIISKQKRCYQQRYSIWNKKLFFEIWVLNFNLKNIFQHYHI